MAAQLHVRIYKNLGIFGIQEEDRSRAEVQCGTWIGWKT